MKPVQKIVVPTDFSNSSDLALEFAIDLARRYEASLDVVHVYQPPSYALPEGYLVPNAQQVELLISESERLLQLAKQKVQAGRVKAADATLLQGRTVEEIVSFAKSRGHDLIVMGTHGRSGLSHVLLGSIAEQVVRRGPCPVLTVRATDSK